MLLLQRFPFYTPGIPSTTCRHLQWPYKNVFQAGDFILSLEKPERCDPLRNLLSYKAVACLSEVLKSAWNHKTGKRGLGKHGEERWHVTCFESLCWEVRKHELLLSPEDGILSWAPSMEFGHHIFADERRIPTYPGKFNVESPHKFALELWKATQLFDDRQAHGAHFMPSIPPHSRLPRNLIEGRDGQSLYLNNATRNFRGEMPWGEIAEVSAADVRGVTLGEMALRGSAMLTPKYQARRVLKQKEDMAKKAWKEEEATATSPNEADSLTANEKGNEVLAATKHNPDTSTGDMQAAPAPMKGSAKPPFVPTKRYTAPQAVQAMGQTTAEIADVSENETNGPMPSKPTSSKQNIVVTAAGATCLEQVALAATKPSRKRNRPKVNRQGDSAATASENKALGADVGVADKDSEDDVVFLSRKKIKKAAKDPPEKPDKTRARETGRSRRGGGGRWRYR